MRRMKVFGLALVAVFALTAIAAASAFATYDSTAETTTLHGEQATLNVFTTEFGTVECAVAEFDGTQTGTELPDGKFTTDEIQVHPNYEDCTAFGLEATVNTAACEYNFHTAEPTTAEGFDAQAQVDIVNCGSGIVVTAAGGLCQVTVPEQDEVGLVDFKNEAGNVLVRSTANEIDYEGTGGICSGAKTGGVYTGDVLVEGNGGAAEISVTG